MARLVLGVGVPHTPFFPAIAKAKGEASRMAMLFNRVRREVEAAKPDLIVMFTADHFIGFFFSNMPTFCIGTFEHADGPHELSRTMPWYRVQGDPEFAAGLLEYGIECGFDLASTEEMKLDHAALVPLHFLTPQMSTPFVPVYIKALAEPLPKAARCFALGQMVRQYIDRSPTAKRVAVIASGSFSLEVGGPRMGHIDQEWYNFVLDRLRNNEIDELVRAASSQRMRAAGNTGGELLTWIALMGALGERKLHMFEPDASPPESPRDAHAYAVWSAVS